MKLLSQSYVSCMHTYEDSMKRHAVRESKRRSDTKRDGKKMDCRCCPTALPPVGLAHKLQSENRRSHRYLESFLFPRNPSSTAVHPTKSREFPKRATKIAPRGNNNKQHDKGPARWSSVRDYLIKTKTRRTGT